MDERSRLNSDAVGRIVPAWVLGPGASVASWPNKHQASSRVASLHPLGRVRGRRLLNLDEASFSPSRAFADPVDVLRHPLLSMESKREILQRWAFDEYLMECASDDGMPGKCFSRLAEVRSALLRLDDDWRPHPAAPAAFAVQWQSGEQTKAA